MKRHANFRSLATTLHFQCVDALHQEFFENPDGAQMRMYRTGAVEFENANDKRVHSPADSR